MGTMTDGVGSQASSTAILIGFRSEFEGRETVICEVCGRGQFNRGQEACIACHSPLLAVLEPLCDSPTMPRKKPAFEPGRACIRLAQLRRLLEIPQSVLALRVRCPRPNISRYENGTIIPTLAFLDRVTAGLHITMAEMLDEAITVEELALRSLLRSPGDGDFVETLIKFLPKLNKNSRALLVQAAKSFHRSPLAHAR